MPVRSRTSVCFKQLSVLDNVKAGLHNKHHYPTISGILRLPSYRKVEKEMDEQAMELLKVFDLDQVARVTASNLPYGQQRRLRSQGRWLRSRSFCSWMSRRPHESE